MDPNQIKSNPPGNHQILEMARLKVENGGCLYLCNSPFGVNALS